MWVTPPISDNCWKLQSVTGINSPYSCIWRLWFFKCVFPLLSSLQAFLVQQDLCRGRNIEVLCWGTGFCFKAHSWYSLKYSWCSDLDTGWVYCAWFFSKGVKNPIICLPTDLLISYLMLPSYYLLISFTILHLHSCLVLNPSETWEHDAVSQETFGNRLFVGETNDIRWNKEFQGLTLTYLYFSNTWSSHIEFLWIYKMYSDLISFVLWHFWDLSDRKLLISMEGCWAIKTLQLCLQVFFTVKNC